MRIAVTYENNEIFRHFGQTSEFKVYEIEDNKIVSSSILSSDGKGHGALAQVLADNNIDVLICGGLGDGALSDLKAAGIEVCAGAEGDCDKAVEAYLAGELKDSGANCDHHDHEESHSCGGGCGSCGGCGHHAPVITLEGKNAGKTVRVHYRGTLNDGTQFDSSYDRGETLDFICGAGQMISGFDKAVVDMEVGEKISIHLMPEEAYGMADPNAIFTLSVSQLPGSEELNAGERVYLYNQMGQPMPVTVVSREGDSITFDANHEMAGKELNFDIELVEVK